MNDQRVDLHLHSPYSRGNGDVIKWNDALDILIKLRENNVKVFAITDHDYFSASLHIKLKEIINQKKFDILLLPGFELTIKRKNNEFGHILFIFKPLDDQKQIQLLEDFICEHKSSNGINLDLFIKQLDELDFEYFIVPHIGKCYYVIYEDVVNQIEKIAYVESKSNDKRLINFNDSSKKQFVNLMFTDTHDWEKYKKPRVCIQDEINFDNIKNKLIFVDDNN